MQIQTSLGNFVPVSKLGEGTFSSVYKVKRLSDNKIYALKKIRIATLKQRERLNALNQVRILASISSPFIISYKQAFFDQQLKVLCIVMECAQNGDLSDMISKAKQNRNRIPQSQIWKAAYHILSGLKVLHGTGILHRDLKSANIFVSQGIYKLGDLNVAKVSSSLLARTQTGTPYYASPQVWRDQPYGSASDIWSLGCILYEMASLQPPFSGSSLPDLFKSIKKGVYKPLSNQYSYQLKQLISRCLQQNSYLRPTVNTLLQKEGSVLSRCQFYEIIINNNQNNNLQLINTIKMPSDMNRLNNYLPSAQYQPQKTSLKTNIMYQNNNSQSKLQKYNNISIKKQQKKQNIIQRQNSVQKMILLPKRRPLSCNPEHRMLSPRQKIRQSNDFKIQNLINQKRVVPVYMSQRRQINGLLKQLNDKQQNIRLKNLQKQPNKQKYRCKSANIRPHLSIINDIKKNMQIPSNQYKLKVNIRHSKQIGRINSQPYIQSSNFLSPRNQRKYNPYIGRVIQSQNDLLNGLQKKNQHQERRTKLIKGGRYYVKNQNKL